MITLCETGEPGFAPIDIDAMTDEEARTTLARLHKSLQRFQPLIDSVFISVRLSNGLRINNCETPDAILSRPSEQWKKTGHIGKTSYNELREAMGNLGYPMPKIFR